MITDRFRSSSFARPARYAASSAAATIVTLGLLGLLVGSRALSAGPANVVATAAGTVLAFVLNRRWVWSRRGRVSVGREIVPFWLLAFGRLGASTAAVSLAGRVAADWRWGTGPTTLLTELASLTTFAVLWIVQYAVLDRFVFADRGTGSAVVSL